MLVEIPKRITASLVFGFVLLSSVSAQHFETVNIEALPTLDGSFCYEYSPGIKYKGLRNICTTPNSVHITCLEVDKRTKTIKVEGVSTFGHGPIDTSNKEGFCCVDIFVGQPDDKWKLHKIRNLGTTNDYVKNPTNIGGYFLIQFKVEPNDVLVIGIGGEGGGATAFEVGKLFK